MFVNVLTIVSLMTYRSDRMLGKVQRVSNWLKKLVPVLVFIDLVLALTVGYYRPHVVKSLNPLVTPAMMLMLIPPMMGLVIGELKLVTKDKKILAVALTVNFVLSPLIGFLWAQLFFMGLDPKFIVGWLLKLTIPCSAMVVAWTGMSKGKVETALVIQVVSFLMAILAVPFWMVTLAGAFVPVDPVLIFKKILLIIVVPMVVGVSLRELLMRSFGQEWFKKELKPFLPPLSTLGMYLIIFIAVGSEVSLVLQNLHLFWILIASVVIVYPAIAILSLVSSKLAGIKYEDGIAIIFSTTAKNHGIAIALAVSSFGGLSVIPPSIVPMIQVLLMVSIFKSSGITRRILSG